MPNNFDTMSETKSEIQIQKSPHLIEIINEKKLL